jgi:hypothetical protein
METPPITLRPAVPEDAQTIGAVFDDAVRESWTYLGGLALEPMFTPRTGRSSSPIMLRGKR